MSDKLLKKLDLASRILFNLFAVLLGLILCVSAAAKVMESFLTENLFGGYKTDIIAVEQDAADLSYFSSKWDSVKQERAASGNMGVAAVSEGSVLLENNGALPLEKGETVSLFGASAYAPVYGIGGAGHIAMAEKDRIMFRTALEEAGLKVNAHLADWYKTTVDGYDIANWRYDIGRGVDTNKKNNPYINEENWDKVAPNIGSDKGDTALFVIGRLGCEDIYGDLSFAKGSVSDHSTYAEGDYLQLNQNEVSMLRGLRTQFENVVLIVNSPSPVELRLLETEDYRVDAALWVGALGSTGIWAVGDLLVGTATPSGRLSDQWYKDNAQNPVLTNWAAGYSVVYQEGVYLGYRYAETRYEDYVLGREKTGTFNYGDVIKYPFGYGRSYTEFSYRLNGVTYHDEVSAEAWKGHSVTYRDVYEVDVTVTNEGDFAGKEVVQVYVQQPYTPYDIQNGVEKPSVELAGYAKTSKLDPKKSELVKIYVPRAYFATFDRTKQHTVEGEQLTGTYLLEEGDYYLTVAKDAHAAVNNILEAKGVTQEQRARMTGAGDKSLVWSEFGIDETDAETYGVSVNTGYKIESLFDSVDPRYVADGNNVTFISRSNWEGTVKLMYSSSFNESAGYFVRTRNEGVKAETENIVNKGPDTVSADEVIEKYGLNQTEYPAYGKNHESTDEGHLNLIDLRVRIDPESGEYVEVPYDDPLWDRLLDQLTWEETVKLVGEGRRMTTAIASIAKPQTIDQNGSNGLSQRYRDGVASQSLAVKTNDPDADEYMTGYPCEGIIASSFNNRLAYLVGEAMGEDSLWSGEAGIYGFGLNLHRSPYHGRYAEYYSEDPVLTGTMAGYETIGASSMGTMVYNKHLALNEQETGRSAAYTWVYETALRELYLRPFEIAAALSDGRMNIMTSYNRLGAIWSGNNYALCTTFLRHEAGVEGFVITDWYKSAAMNMVPGILCGQNLPDGTEPAEEFDAYKPGAGNKNGATIAWAMRESAHRILFMVVHSNAMNGIGTGTRVIVYEPAWIGALQAVVITIGVAFGISAGFMIAMRAVRIRRNSRKGHGEE